MPADLFPEPAELALGDGATLLRGAAAGQESALLDAVNAISAAAPFRHMVTPGGWQMSAAMTNCGAFGWVTDRRGYRYSEADPETGKAWPEMPPLFISLACEAATRAGFADFMPDGCLINRYVPGARMSLHQDLNERDIHAPIVSVSLGLQAIFLWGGQTRAEKPQRIKVASGDVVVWGGASRMNFHGIAPLATGHHPIFGDQRINLTFRKVQ